jgi:hypothetical protein
MATSSKNQTATWNRDDRDLLVELRTNMGNLQKDIADARSEIKEISTGITARVLNLETNAVNRVELGTLEVRMRALEDKGNQWLGKSQLISAAIGIAAGLLGSFIQGGKTI